MQKTRKIRRNSFANYICNNVSRMIYSSKTLLKTRLNIHTKYVLLKLLYALKYDIAFKKKLVGYTHNYGNNIFLNAKRFT